MTQSEIRQPADPGQPRRLAAWYAATRAIAESSDPLEAQPRVLGAVCESLGWDVGALWQPDTADNCLHCVALWQRPGSDVAAFVAQTRSLSFEPGIGLPGRVWASASPTWIADVQRDPNFPRAATAATAGLRGAFAFPIAAEGKVLGVMEFLSSRVESPDGELLEMMATIGNQLGQLILRRQAEVAVRVSEARKTAMLEAALDCIITIDHQGRIVELNPATEQTFGFPRGAIIGRELAETIVPPQLREAHRRGLERYLATGEAVVLGKRLELPAVRADGSELTVELAITTIATDGPPMFTAYLRDVTAQREFEQQRNEFLAAASHDLKNPLASIKGMSQYLQRSLERTGSLDPERLQTALGQIDATTTRMADLVDQLLDVARLQMGRLLELEPGPTDLVALAQRAAEEHRQTSERHRILVETSETELVGYWDVRRLGRVMDNLVGNAIKYSPDGGDVNLSLHRQADGDGQWAILAVSDRGIGIPDADLPRIFQRFFRARNAAGRIDGVGIGLAGARQIVEQHGGTITVASQRDAGTVFTVRLPLGCHPQPRETETTGGTSR